MIRILSKVFSGREVDFSSPGIIFVLTSHATAPKVTIIIPNDLRLLLFQFTSVNVFQIKCNIISSSSKCSFDMTTLGSNTGDRLPGFEMIEIKFGLLDFIQMSRAFIKSTTVTFKSLHFLCGNCIKEQNKSGYQGGFDGSKKIKLFFFHNPEFIVSQ